MKLVATRCKPFSNFGGMEKYSLKLAEALSLQNEVIFITGEGIFSIYMKKIEKIYNLQTKNSIDSIIKVNDLAYREIKKRNIKSLYFFGHVGIISLLFLPKIFDTNFFGLGYECIFDKDIALKKKIKNFFHRIFMKITVKRVNKLFVIEKSQAAYISQYFKRDLSEIKILENFIDNKEIPEDYNFKPKEKKIVLSIGRDCASKCRNQLINDWISLYKNNKSYKLIVISKNLNQKLIKKISENNNIEYLNNIGDSDLARIRRKAFFDISYSNQGIPLLTSLESISYGCIPIVNNSHGGYFNNQNSIQLSKLKYFTEDEAKTIYKNSKENLKKRSLKMFEKKVLNESL